MGLHPCLTHAPIWLANFLPGGGLPGLKEAVSPLGQRGRCDTQLSREDVEFLTPQKT